jgi:hypothetical protein
MTIAYPASSGLSSFPFPSYLAAPFSFFFFFFKFISPCLFFAPISPQINSRPLANQLRKVEMYYKATVVQFLIIFIFNNGPDVYLQTRICKLYSLIPKN